MNERGSFAKMRSVASARMSGLRQSVRSPRPQLIVARLSIIVTGQSALAATLSSRTSSARPCAMRVMPNLEMAYGDLAARGADVDGGRHHEDVAELLRAHRRQHVVRAGERAAGVDVHDEIELLEGRVGERLPEERARVVDEEVDAPELVERLLDGALDGGVVADVEGQRQRAAPERLDLARRVADRARDARVGRDGLRGDDDVAPVARERERDGLADAPGCPADEGDLSRKHRRSVVALEPRLVLEGRA